MSPGRTDARRVATMSAAGGTVTAGSARLPTMTGWTNSTATWWAWNGQFGDAHHMVAPAEKRAGQGQRGPGQVVGDTADARRQASDRQPWSRFQCRTGTPGWEPKSST